MLVVALQAHAQNQNYTLAAQISERIIVRVRAISTQGVESPPQSWEKQHPGGIRGTGGGGWSGARMLIPLGASGVTLGKFPPSEPQAWRNTRPR